MNRLPLIGRDSLCTCTCADPCPLGRTGSAYRCTVRELLAFHFAGKEAVAAVRNNWTQFSPSDGAEDLGALGVRPPLT